MDYLVIRGKFVESSWNVQKRGNGFIDKKQEAAKKAASVTTPTTW